MPEIIETLIQRITEGQSTAYGVIIWTEGSSPQVPGASALITSEGLLSGTLGGGVMEAAVLDEAKSCLKKGVSKLFSFRMKGQEISDAEALCGGEAQVLIDARPDRHLQVFQLLETSMKERIPGILQTSIQVAEDSGIFFTRHWISEREIFGGKADPHPIPFRDEIKSSLASQRPALIRQDREIVFFDPFYPKYRLLILGAGHIGQAVTHIGHLLNFEVTVVDDRTEFANRSRLPEASRIIVEDIGEAVQNIPLDKDSFLVIVTRGHRDDARALKACIQSEAAYIGMIGSVRKIAILRRDFIKEGWASPDQLDKIHAPIGIEIQSKTVQEIAVSIAAQLVKVRSALQGRDGGEKV